MEIPKSKEIVEGYRLIMGYLGVVLILVGIIVLLPLLTIIAYPQEIDNAKFFIIPGIISIFLGYLLSFLIKDKEKGQLHKHQDAFIVVVSWAISIFICAIPFMMTGKYNLTQAVFETTSGFSTTGLSVVDVTVCPKIFLMFRSIMLFFGGVGLVLVMTSAISDRYGMRLYNAEGHADKLLPNLVKSARMIVIIYSGYILSGTILYIIFGMSTFDAINHSIAALSTGGFSTKAENIGYYDSIPIEIITIILMYLGCTNFLVHLMLIKGKIKSFFQHCEVKFMLFLSAFSLPIFCVFLLNGFVDNIPESIRIALFQISTAITTTGFQTIPSFADWNSPLIFMMIILMLIGGGAGSTAGGMKLYRVYISIKDIFWTIRDKFSHKRIVRTNSIVRFGQKEKVDKTSKIEVYSFLGLYIIIFLIGTFIYTMFGYSVEDSMFEFASALGTVGISVGITSYNADPLIMWVAIIGMFLGRLEIYIVFLGIIRLFSDIGNKIRGK